MTSPLGTVLSTGPNGSCTRSSWPFLAMNAFVTSGMTGTAVNWLNGLTYLQPGIWWKRSEFHSPRVRPLHHIFDLG